jgi:hypothetical protein
MEEINKKLEEKYVKKLQDNGYKGDTEAIHAEADGILRELLLELGFTKVIEEYDKSDKWFA